MRKNGVKRFLSILLVAGIAGAENQEGECIAYEETITNSAEAFQCGANLEITVVNDGGPASAEFELEVNFGTREDALGRTFKDGYSVYAYDPDTDTRGALLRTDTATDGTITLKTNEMAVLTLPNHVYYTVEEVQTTPAQYEENGTYSDAIRFATDAEDDRYDLVNSAVQYTGIKNDTLNHSVEHRTNQEYVRNAGGTVGVITESVDEDTSLPTEYEEDGIVTGVTAVYWKNDENWTYGDSFTIEYRCYDDPEAGVDSSEVHTITVNGYIDGEGNLVTDPNASCYDELRAVYPDFGIYENSEGAIVLRLTQDENLQYINEVIVSFRSTLAAINITADGSGGMVKVDGGTFRSNSDGAGENGETRYVDKNKIYAVADEGYVIDLNALESGVAGTITVQTEEDTSSDLRLQLDEDNRFYTYLTQTVGGSDSTYEIEGIVKITEVNEDNEPTAVEIELIAVPVPIDVGVTFVMAASFVGEDLGSAEDAEDTTDEGKVFQLLNLLSPSTAALLAIGSLLIRKRKS